VQIRNFQQNNANSNPDLTMKKSRSGPRVDNEECLSEPLCWQWKRKQKRTPGWQWKTRERNTMLTMKKYRSEPRVDNEKKPKRTLCFTLTKSRSEPCADNETKKSKSKSKKCQSKHLIDSDAIQWWLIACDSLFCSCLIYMQFARITRGVNLSMQAF
jgi:hypothetical protein